MNNTMPDPDPTAALSRAVDVLAEALALWATRDDSKAQPEVRQAANIAVDVIDGMLAGLHCMRAALVTEKRESDDISEARARALADQLRREFPDDDQ